METVKRELQEVFGLYDLISYSSLLLTMHPYLLVMSQIRTLIGLHDLQTIINLTEQHHQSLFLLACATFPCYTFVFLMIFLIIFAAHGRLFNTQWNILRG